MIFGVLNPEKTWHTQLVHLPTSPVHCSHFTLGNPKKSFLTALFIHTSDYLRYLRRKQTVSPLPTTPEKCHRTTLRFCVLGHSVCMFVRRFSPLQTTAAAGRPAAALRVRSHCRPTNNSQRIVWVALICLPATIYPPVVQIYRRHWPEIISKLFQRHWMWTCCKIFTSCNTLLR